MLVQSPKLLQRFNSGVLSGFLWASIQIWAHVWSPWFPGIWGSPLRTLFPLYLKWKTKKDPPYSAGDSAQCCTAAWMRRSAAEWIRVCVRLSHSATHLKLSQHCKSAVFQHKLKSQVTKKNLIRPQIFLLAFSFSGLSVDPLLYPLFICCLRDSYAYYVLKCFWCTQMLLPNMLFQSEGGGIKPSVYNGPFGNDKTKFMTSLWGRSPLLTSGS